MAVGIYINFNGNCREAVEYYAQVFGAELQEITAFGDAPQNPEYSLPEEAKNRILI